MPRVGRAREPEPVSIYPPYVVTSEERRRWDLAAGIARQLFGDVDEASVWMATRAIFRGGIPTDS